MLGLTRPRYVLPVHGDHKRIRLHGEIAEAIGIPPERIFAADNGIPLEITHDGAKLGEPEQAGMIFVDGSSSATQPSPRCATAAISHTTGSCSSSPPSPRRTAKRSPRTRS